MNDDRFDRLTRSLATASTRRSFAAKALAALSASVVLIPRQAVQANPPAKVTVCQFGPNGTLIPKELPPPAAAAFVKTGKAILTVENSDTPCEGPCGPDCLSCPQLPPFSVCIKCVDGQCTCPESTIVATSYQGGDGGTDPLLGSQYQIFDAANSSPVTGVQTVTDAASASVTFGPFPGDTSFCIREVFTPAGSTVIGDDSPCVHLGCGFPFLWTFHHDP